MNRTLALQIFLPLASALCIAGATPLSSAESKSHYFKVGPDEKQSLIIEFSGDSLKVAETVAKLKKAEPVKCQRRENRNKTVNIISPQVTLEFPASKGKKAMVSKAQMNLMQHSRGATLYGMLTIELKDKKGTTYTYMNRIFSRPVTDPSKAKLIKSLSSEGVDLKITNRLNKRDKKKMGVAVQLITASGDIYDVKKGKASSTAKVKITDPDGETSEVEKTLGRLGYG